MSGTLLYLDSSALVKLVLPEPETEALREILSLWPERFSSALTRVEVLRAVRQAGVGRSTYERAENVVARVGLVDVDERVLNLAARIDPPELRSLDAIHLATALSIPDLGGLVSYEAPLVRAATRSSVTAMAPGAEL